MTSITTQRMGEYTYINESESFWNPAKKCPDNKKTRIGKMDPTTGDIFYKQEYIDRLKAEGKPTDGMLVWSDLRRSKRPISSPTMSGEINQAFQILDTIKDYGVVFFLKSIAEKIGLLNIISSALPDCWQEIFTLACYLIASDKPVMYCDDWVDSNECQDVGSMSSQRISDLLIKFGFSSREAFYKGWYNYIREQEYIALDITSVSSYSGQITECEWGYNRDHEDMPQINICMLFGEESKLPVYQTIYSGSLKDVSTLESTMKEFTALTGDDALMIVMDKGFFSAKNVDMLLGDGKYKFLISIPFTSGFARRQLESERKDIDHIQNVVLTHAAPIRGICKLRSWGTKGEKLHTHIYFDPDRALKTRNELYGHVIRMKAAALQDPENEKLRNDFKKYLNVRKSDRAGEGVTVSIREDVVAKELETAGWFVLISNQINDAQAAHDVYRAKDVVEKAFLKYKNNLSLDRLRVHGDERMQNKVFVAFIALILVSHIYKIMNEKQMFRQMTFDKLLLTLSKLKAVTVGGKRILRPLTKEQKMIFEHFGINQPTVSESSDSRN